MSNINIFKKLGLIKSLSFQLETLKLSFPNLTTKSLTAYKYK